MGQNLIWNFLLISQGAANEDKEEGKSWLVVGRVRVKDLNNILCVHMLVRVEWTVILGWDLTGHRGCDSLIPH